MQVSSACFCVVVGSLDAINSSNGCSEHQAWSPPLCSTRTTRCPRSWINLRCTICPNRTNSSLEKPVMGNFARQLRRSIPVSFVQASHQHFGRGFRWFQPNYMRSWSSCWAVSVTFPLGGSREGNDARLPALKVAGKNSSQNAAGCAKRPMKKIYLCIIIYIHVLYMYYKCIFHTDMFVISNMILDVYSIQICL